MMIKRSTWIVFGIFLALIVVFVYLQNRPLTSSDDAEPTVDLSTLNEVTHIMDLDESETLTYVEVIDSMGSVIVFNQDVEIGWTMVVSDTEYPVDAAAIERSVAQLRSLTSEADLDPDTDLAAVGLVEGSHQINIETDQGDTYRIVIGLPTITGNGYYVSVNGGAPQIVDKIVVDGWIGFLDVPPYEPTPTAESIPTLDLSEEENDGADTPAP